MTGRARYDVRIKRSAQREMDALPVRAFDRLAKAIVDLEACPRPRGCKKLRGVENYRLRVGDYWVLYSVDDSRRVVEVVAVGHRRDVYRDL